MKSTSCRSGTVRLLILIVNVVRIDRDGQTSALAVTSAPAAGMETWRSAAIRSAPDHEQLGSGLTPNVPRTAWPGEVRPARAHRLSGHVSSLSSRLSCSSVLQP